MEPRSDTQFSPRSKAPTSFCKSVLIKFLSELCCSSIFVVSGHTANAITLAYKDAIKKRSIWTTCACKLYPKDFLGTGRPNSTKLPQVCRRKRAVFCIASEYYSCHTCTASNNCLHLVVETFQRLFVLRRGKIHYKTYKNNNFRVPTPLQVS